MKTLPVKHLVEEVLATIPQPHSEDVIEDVFVAIESRPSWRNRYDELCHELNPHVVNQMAGKWVSIAEGRAAVAQVDATRSGLITSYSKLDRRH